MSGNSVTWGFGLKKPYRFPLNDICYAAMFSTYRPRPIPNPVGFFPFCVDGHDGKGVKLANWYLRNYIIPSLPERVLQAIEIERLFRKSVHNFYGTLESSGVIPWINVRVDTSQICSEDLYILLDHVRHAQENYDLLELMWKNQQDYPHVSLDMSFLYAACVRPMGGHALIGTYSFPGDLDYQATKTMVENWSLKKAWQNIECNEKSFFEYQGKKECSDMLTVWRGTGAKPIQHSRSPHKYANMFSIVREFFEIYMKGGNLENSRYWK